MARTIRSTRRDERRTEHRIATMRRQRMNDRIARRETRDGAR